MEIQSNFNYSVPYYECFEGLKQVLPNLGIVYWMGYSLASVPLGKVGVKVAEEHDRVGLLKGHMQIWAYNLIPYTLGPELKFYCVGSGNNLCTVEMVSEGSAYGNYLMNLTADLAKGMWPKFLRRGFPNVYFDDEVVYDSKTYTEDSYRDDANVRMYKYIFNKAAGRLGEHLKSNPGA